jgi:GH24 family phage-related lysozyme (muramidase)
MIMINVNLKRVISSVIFGLMLVMGFSARADEVDDAVVLVAKFEGFRSKQYSDHGQMAIGYGTEVGRAKKLGYKGGEVTEAQAKLYLKKCVAQEVQFLKESIPSYTKLKQNQKAALISLSYNSRELVGPNLKAYIKAKNFNEAAKEIGLGHNATLYGLIKRRAAEANHFAGKVVITEQMVAMQRK